MSNGDQRLEEAEIELILSGGQAKVNKFLVESQIKMGKEIGVLKRTCQERGMTCPGLRSAQSFRFIVDRYLLPVLIAVSAALFVIRFG